MQTGCNVKKQRRTLFFFHVTLTRSTGELQQLKAIRWSVGIESHVLFQEKQNKTNAARKYSCWLDTKNHWCLNYEPNSAYNLLVSRVLMNYFMREESIFRCYTYRCQNTLIWSKRFINVQSDICKNNHEAVDYSYSSTVDNRLRSGNFALRLIGAISQSVYSSVIKLVHYLIQNMYGNVLKAFY